VRLSSTEFRNSNCGLRTSSPKVSSDRRSFSEDLTQPYGSEIRNPQSAIRNLLSSRWRPILGTLLVLAGLATAIVTLMARRIGEPEAASIGAIASLLFVLLIMILVVPPLARSAFAEVAERGLPIEVTTGGVVFIIILVIVAFAAWNTGNNLLFMVFSIMLSMLALESMRSKPFPGNTALMTLLAS